MVSRQDLALRSSAAGKGKNLPLKELRKPWWAFSIVNSGRYHTNPRVLCGLESRSSILTGKSYEKGRDTFCARVFLKAQEIYHSTISQVQSNFFFFTQPSFKYTQCSKTMLCGKTYVRITFVKILIVR